MKHTCTNIQHLKEAHTILVCPASCQPDHKAIGQVSLCVGGHAGEAVLIGPFQEVWSGEEVVAEYAAHGQIRPWGVERGHAVGRL